MDIMKRSEQAIAVSNCDAGFEDLRAEDFEMPRVQLVQAMSQVMQNGTDGIKAGDIINNVTNTKLTGRFIPILAFVQWVKFADGQMVYSTSDPSAKEVEDDPDAWKAKRLSFLVKCENEHEPLLLSFYGASAKVGKRFASTARSRGGALYSHVYRLSSEKQQNDKGSFFVFKVSPDGDPDEKSLLDAAKMYNTYKGQLSKLRKQVETMADAPEYTASSTFTTAEDGRPF